MKLKKKSLILCELMCDCVQAYTNAGAQKSKWKHIAGFLSFQPVFNFQSAQKTHKCIVGPRLNGWEIEIHWNWDQRVRQNEQRWHKTSNNKQFKKEFSVEIISNDIYRVLLSLLLLVFFFLCVGSVNFEKGNYLLDMSKRKREEKQKNEKRNKL